MDGSAVVKRKASHREHNADAKRNCLGPPEPLRGSHWALCEWVLVFQLNVSVNTWLIWAIEVTQSKVGTQAVPKWSALHGLNQEEMILVKCPHSTHGETETQRKENYLPTAVRVWVCSFHHEDQPVLLVKILILRCSESGLGVCILESTPADSYTLRACQALV